jgi:hypothetical protein
MSSEPDLFTLLPPEERPRRRPPRSAAEVIDRPLLGGPLHWQPANRGYVVCSDCGHWSALIGADEAGDYRHDCPRSPRTVETKDLPDDLD